VAHTRNPEGKDWGLLLRWYDLDNVMHEWAMPYSALGGRPEEIWRAMLAGGLRITSIRGGREKLAQYLSTAKSSLRARGVERTGWYIAPPIVAFVLPDKTYGESAYERIRWQTDNQGETLYRIAGSLEEWRREIGRRCVGNSRLAVCVSAAFGAALLRLAEESGGVVSCRPQPIREDDSLARGRKRLGRRPVKRLSALVAHDRKFARSDRRCALRLAALSRRIW
jgi:putative DNA primase/helicase